MLNIADSLLNNIIRCIYELCDLHLPAENYTEAAFALKLAANFLTWSMDIPEPKLMGDNQVPVQQPAEWIKKEHLYFKIIDYFDKGKCWEEGLPLFKELGEFYERRLFDYQKLSAVLVS